VRRELGQPRHLAHQAVRGLVQVVRHLDGQHACRRQGREQAGNQLLVPADPLQRGIGVDQVARRLPGGRAPGGDVGLGEGDAGQTLARRLQHGG